jgi:UDP-2,3-diacylglucosamine pyrophosphatase LpxH
MMPKRAESTKTIFISDIHLGDELSWKAEPHPYCWCMENVSTLATFLKQIQNDRTVKELVILGDLFDIWIIPAKYPPLTSFDRICDWSGNKPVIDILRNKEAWGEIRINYAVGNHDMPIGRKYIKDLLQFMGDRFPLMECLFNEDEPLGKYESDPLPGNKPGILLAEHGNRYCLFNGLNQPANLDNFLPLGYFISRLVANWAVNRGNMLMSDIWDYIETGYTFLANWKNEPNFFGNMLASIGEKAKIRPEDQINVENIPGYSGTKSLHEIAESFKDVCKNWKNCPGNIGFAKAFTSEVNDFWVAAQRQIIGGRKIVIFGHTHKPGIFPKDDPDKRFRHLEAGKQTSEFPHESIYANSGGWVDKRYYPGHECTYIETEEVRVGSERRHYVRLKNFPENSLMGEGFVLVED